MQFPTWSYFPRNTMAPAWVDQFVTTVADAESVVSTARNSGLKSDEVLIALADGLENFGYAVERGKKHAQKIFRTVLFGENGKPTVRYEVDAFHDGLGIAVEVEAGRGAANNADFRDIVRTSLILDARFLVLVVPVDYKEVKAYRNSRDQLDALYASDRLRFPFEGVLLVGD